MAGLPTMVFALVASTLLVVGSTAAPAHSVPAAPAAAPGLKAADAVPGKDLEGAETYGYGYGLPYASYYNYYPHYRSYRYPYSRYYGYGYPYNSWDDYYYYYW